MKEQIEEMIETLKKCSCVYTDCEQECSQCSNEELYDEALNHIARTLYEEEYRKIPKNIGEFSDGYHTFNELYHHRAVLFSVICNMFPDKAWKSKFHDTGDMYDGMFIVGIETEQGQATYHYDIEPYWDMFKVKELEKAPKWDGHTPSDAIQRIGNISVAGYRKQIEGEWEWFEEWNPSTPEHPRECDDCGWRCGECKTALADIVGGYWDDPDEKPKLNLCPNCGARMSGEKNEYFA